MKVSSAIILVIVKSILFLIMRLFGFAPEIPSPKPRTDRRLITWDRVVEIEKALNLPSIYIVTVQDTNSMDGLLDTRHLILMTKEFNIEDLGVGDVIFYRRGLNANLHQIVYIGEDKKGIFYICKGLNCFFPDPFSIRPSEIVSLMRGIIY